jgi:hypothetical protein
MLDRPLSGVDDVRQQSYTRDVLPEDSRTGSKAADIAREIAFCAKELAG